MIKKPSFLKTFSISKLLPKISKRPTVPGTVSYVGQKRKTPVTLHLLDYDETDYTDKNINSIKESLPFKESPTVTWLNISGVHNTKIIEDIGEYFHIHPLILEDIANTTQRPKLEEYDDYLFIILKMAYFKENTSEVVLEQVSLIVGKDYVISFQEKEGDVLEGLRARIRNNKGRVRKLGSDYLAYGIMDMIVDNYFLVLEQIGERIETQEEKLMYTADQKMLNSIYHLKQELLFLRKSIWPLREVVSRIQRAEHNLIQESTIIYLRDVYDHTIQVIETVETFRDMASGMLDLYLSTISNKMNEVMKVLTIFATIFIPLTFIVGVYGMNFEYMPELHWKLGYFGIWGIMVAVMLVMFIFFKKKKWI